MKNILRIVVVVLTVALMTQVAMAEEPYSSGQPTEDLYRADVFHPITIALFSGAEAGKKASRGNQNLADVAIREFSKAKWLAGNYNVGIKKLGKDRVKLLFVKGFAYGVLGDIPVIRGGNLIESRNGVSREISSETNTIFQGPSGADGSADTGYLRYYHQITNSPLTANSSMAAANSQITTAKLPQLLTKSIFYGAYSPKYRGRNPQADFPAEEYFLVKLAEQHPDLFALYISLVDQMPPYSKREEDIMYKNDNPWARARGYWILETVAAYIIGNEGRNQSWLKTHSVIRDYIRILEKEESGAPLCAHKDYHGVKKGFNSWDDLPFGFFPLFSPTTDQEIRQKVSVALEKRYGVAQDWFWGVYAYLPAEWIDKNDKRMESFWQCLAYHESDILPEVYEGEEGVWTQHMIGAGYLKTKNYIEAEKWFSKAASQGDMSSVIALNDLGIMYHEGKGAPPNHPKAAELFQKAAERGNTPACYNLGVYYKNGWGGLTKDSTEARKWLSKAADQGYEDAKEALETLE